MDGSKTLYLMSEVFPVKIPRSIGREATKTGQICSVPQPEDEPENQELHYMVAAIDEPELE